MSLLYSSKSIIRGQEIDLKGRISLSSTDIADSENLSTVKKLVLRQELMEQKVQEAESKYHQILINIKNESTEIIENSKQKALDIEKKAYEEGYNQGLKNGYEDGYKEAYEVNIEKAQLESEKILKSAEETLKDAQNQVVNFLEENKSDILNLSISIAEQVLRSKFTDKNSMTELLDSIINEYKIKKSFVIRTNPIYRESLQNQVKNWAISLNIKGDIFIIEDKNIDEGNALIETENGKLVVGIDSVLERIKDELV